MTIIKRVEDQDEIYNDAGLQLIGSHQLNGNGLNPRELLEAALGLCVSISIQKIMDYDGITYDKNTIRVEVTSAKPEDKANRFSNFYVRVTLPPGLEPAYKEKLNKVTERACTIGNTLRHGAIVETVEFASQD
ncbi:OsmC family protein [Paenibacillus sp. S150]|uniref:OsmC family protein n=1 Tax=Paenibacillus sp. S150 TaxID=2749826 RepID=UPI001C56985B|nr:OsmC family protein [Paenibacillus sp. S150]MBW4083643.1 OsmC family protein [Paenibacillus sp. S150]